MKQNLILWTLWKRILLSVQTRWKLATAELLSCQGSSSVSDCDIQVFSRCNAFAHHLHEAYPSRSLLWVHGCLHTHHTQVQTISHMRVTPLQEALLPISLNTHPSNTAPLTRSTKKYMSWFDLTFVFSVYVPALLPSHALRSSGTASYSSCFWLSFLYNKISCFLKARISDTHPKVLLQFSFSPPGKRAIKSHRQKCYHQSNIWKPTKKKAFHRGTCILWLHWQRQSHMLMGYEFSTWED